MFESLSHIMKHEDTHTQHKSWEAGLPDKKMCVSLLSNKSNIQESQLLLQLKMAVILSILQLRRKPILL